MLKRIIPFAHQLLMDTVQNNDIVVDGTCGNGNDTLLLASLVGPKGQVYAFDVQEEAIKNTKEKLQANDYYNTSYILDSHAKIKAYIKDEHKGKIAAAIFNLGYLPGSDKTVVTKPESTIEAVDHLLQYIQKDGLLILVVYHGHSEGKTEKEEILSFATQLDQKQYAVLQYGFINQVNHPPFIVAIQKR